MPITHFMKLKVDHVLLSTLPENTRRRSAPEFANQVSRKLRQLFEEIGGLITSISVSKDDVQVTWNDEGNDPLVGIVKMLEKQRYPEAILLLELFKSDQPDNPDYLYNLGMAYSDHGELERALSNLRRLLELAPKNINGRVALGVALMRQGQDKQAVQELRRAVEQAPDNPWAQRNMGGCLLRLGKPLEALEYLKIATELNPNDDRAWYGLGQAYEVTGDLEQADEAYKRTADIDEFGDVAEQAKQARSKIAEKNFRSVTPQIERMDAVMYCLGAMEKFEMLPPDRVRQIGFEVAMLGMNGIDVNDPTPKYHLKALPGIFSGLHLLCLEYVSFKQLTPELDIGFDLSREYHSAQALFEQKKNQGNQ